MIKYLFIPFIFLNCHAGFFEFADAIWQVETNKGRGHILGDNGKSLGPLQISRFCWTDAQEHGNFGGEYEDVVNLEYARMVLFYYILKYEPEIWVKQDWESMARLWNGGPNWRNKMESTDQYWGKVKKLIE